MSRNTGPSTRTRELVYRRDDWRCARCTGWGPLTLQHRVRRGMGGTKDPAINLPGNLITLCGSGTTGCHGWVEGHGAWAKAHGLAVHWATDPVSVPVWTWRGWVHLDAAGDLTELPDHVGVPDCACGCWRENAVAVVWN